MHLDNRWEQSRFWTEWWWAFDKFNMLFISLKVQFLLMSFPNIWSFTHLHSFISCLYVVILVYILLMRLSEQACTFIVFITKYIVSITNGHPQPEYTAWHICEWCISCFCQPYLRLLCFLALCPKIDKELLYSIKFLFMYEKLYFTSIITYSTGKWKYCHQSSEKHDLSLCTHLANI